MVVDKEVKDALINIMKFEDNKDISQFVCVDYYEKLEDKVSGINSLLRIIKESGNKKILFESIIKISIKDSNFLFNFIPHIPKLKDVLKEELLEEEIDNFISKQLNYCISINKELLSRSNEIINSISQNCNLVNIANCLREDIAKINNDKKISNGEKKMESENEMDIGIITVLPPEINAVKKYLKNCEREPGKNTRRVYYKGNFDGYNGFFHKVIITQQVEEGNLSTIDTYKDIVSEFNPTIMVLIGIAGCIDPKMKLCDVVIADQIIYYEKRKDTGKIIEIRGEGYKIHSNAKIFINEFFGKFGEDPKMESSSGSLESKFCVKKGPIGSGEAIIGNKSSKIKSWLKTFNSKTLAVETEAAGFAHANEEAQLSRNYKQLGYLIIRGISDHADHKKDDKWRIPASENAVRILVEILKVIPKLK